ncbi:MAG TPA: hypothetical protein VFD36_23630 [Kofleriaceae bacterium]|nr:hypothetical protein [Kofleriaceae bacterium]
MMLKVLPLTALALGLSSGAAFADRGHGGDHRGGYEHRGDNRGSVVVRDHGNRGNTVVVRDHWRGNNNVVIRDHGYRGGYRNVVRRPIYVSRPVIHHRYYNYYRRPAVIFENYAPMTGYYWVSGSWSWNGFEWIWAPGHYEPDPSYYGYYDNY